MPATFKYAQHLSQYTDCPSRTSACENVQAYRFAWNPLCEKSFTPRALTPDNPIRRPKCEDYALSLFAGEDDASRFFDKLRARNPNIGKLLGDHLATIDLVPDHGERTRPDADGHFELFEYANVDLVSASAILRSL